MRSVHTRDCPEWLDFVVVLKELTWTLILVYQLTFVFCVNAKNTLF